MELLAEARIVLWNGGGLWLVDATPVPPGVRRSTGEHAHHAIQIVFGLGGTFRLSTRGASLSDQPVAVAADAPHSFEAQGPVALLFVEPESRAGRAIAERLFAGADLSPIASTQVAGLAGELATVRASASADDLAAVGRALIDRLAAGAAARQIDPRVERVVEWASRHLDRTIGISDAVPVADISAGRLRHLFVEETGLAFKTYLLWQRLTRAVAAVVEGGSLTDAAHEAGFSDSAHLSRTFRRMFGVAPTNLRIR